MFGFLWSLVTPGSPNKPEDIQEDVDDVQVESQSSKDILLGRDGVLVVPSHHHLSVVHQVEGEEEGPHSTVHHLHVLGVGHEDHHDAKDHQSTQQADQDSSHSSEVKLGLF